ncbi:hypothetical protein LSTR_LSTR001087 [Laodelphax striatellus]|uniref:Uncharacterized protein n=1 Tax=Laodelphax striatellus TaxID=195883 RepID=A0A482X1V7_LAOST|nr:hypothetical protein LSTR_LSTR001087 [Laodelphax striatellus]
MTKTGVESENEFDVDEPEEVGKDESKSKTNSRRQSSRVRVSRVPVLKDRGSTDDDLSDEDSDFERSLPKKRMRRSSGGGRSGSGGGRRGRPTRVSSSANGQAADVSNDGSEDNSNAMPESGSDTEPTSTTNYALSSYSPTFQSGSFVVSKKDFKKLTDPPIWKIDGKALLQKFIAFQHEGKTQYKNTSVYSGWSTSTKLKFYPCSVVFKKQSKRETILEFLKDKIVPDENYVCSESEPEGDEDDGDDEREEGEVANGVQKEKKNNDSEDEDHEEEDEEEDEEDEGDLEDEDDENGEKEETGEGKESDEKPKE